MGLYRELQTSLNYKEPVFIKEMKERGKKGRKEGREREATIRETKPLILFPKGVKAAVSEFLFPGRYFYYSSLYGITSPSVLLI